jgi:hypothetical protein
MPNEINTNNRFSADSHFFSEVSSISQSAGQTFGPVSADVFRLTAKFTAQAGAKAFAICPGIVAIQPQTGSTSKINLILRPYQQPIKGVNIRYFIYRGLNKSDFIDSGGNIIPIAPGVSDFIQKINTDFYDFHEDEPTPPEFDAEFIGYRETIADLSAPMDGLFFSVTQYEEQNGEQVEVPETAFELPKVEGGKSLGTFAAGECGIDVVLQYGDFLLNEPDRFAFDYHYARAAEAVIDLTSVSDPVIRKRRKEQLFQFIDIAAFYGFHCVPEGKITTAGNVDHDQSTIYSQVLTPFASKNTYYLYIQADRERSYNFYNTYRIDPQQPENMLYGTSETTLAARAYGTNGWPLILETTPQEHTETRNKICLQLVTDNNPNVVLYGQTACVDNALRNHFSTIEQLKQPVDEENEQPKLTTTIILSNPAVEDGSVKKHIANFGILIYQGVVYSYIAGTEVNDENETVNVYAQPNFFDDVFGNLLSESIYKGANETAYSLVTLDKLKLVNQISHNQQIGVSAVHTMIIRDSLLTGEESNSFFSRVIYVTETIDVCTDAVSVVDKIPYITNSSVTQNAMNQRKTYEIQNPFYEEIGIITDNGQTITTVKLKSYETETVNKIVLGLTKEENQELVALIEANGFLNTGLFLIDLFTDSQTFTSGEGILYKKYNVALIGEDSGGILKLLQPETPINIYSIDDRYHFSRSYSDHIINVRDYRLIHDEI